MESIYGLRRRVRHHNWQEKINGVQGKKISKNGDVSSAQRWTEENIVHCIGKS